MKKKYSMLIVEDEYWIRKSIGELAEKVFGDGLEIRESSNGEDAMDVLELYDISFVLTDINMPFMNGIELIERMRTQYPHIPVLVLSGYSDFHLVRQALTGGALDYMLKPVKEVELTAAIEKVTALIEKNLTEKRQESLYAGYVRDLSISTYVCRKKTGGKEEREEEAEVYFRGIHFPMLMGVVQMDIGKNFSSGEDGLLSGRYAAKERVADWMGIEVFRVIENVYRLGEYFIFFREDEARFNGYGKKLCICISDLIKCREDIPGVYKRMQLKILSNARYGRDYQLIELNAEDEKIDHLRWISEETGNQISQALRQKKKNVLRHLLLEILGISDIEREQWLILEVKQVFGQLRSLIYSSYNREADTYGLWEIDSLCDSIEIAVTSADTGEMIELLEQLLHALVQEEADESEEEKDTNIAARVKGYIDIHYAENLTLSFLAETFYVAPSYLSRSFKKQTGKNLIAYITEKRLLQAAEYIKSEEISFTEAAFMAGYNDYTYFNKVFRRYMGVSPTQYRQDLQRGKECTSSRTKKP